MGVIFETMQRRILNGCPKRQARIRAALAVFLAEIFMTQNLDEQSDASYIERLRAGDISALGGLFDRYYAQVFRTAAAITRDEDVAKDLTQDCFLKLLHYAPRIDTALPLAPWLYRVTVNLSYTWISRRQKRRVSIETLVDRLVSPAYDAPDRVAEFSEVQRAIRLAISQLHFNQRVVIVLHYLCGLSLEEIGEILDCPVGTVKSRLYYARENLRPRLGEVHRPWLEGIPSYAEVSG
ncbi:MAG: RNA polymerase sigma factor [bacterium]|nr:RNA polymerase sigma factor [bacterium]